MTWHVWSDGSCQHGRTQVPKRTPGWGGWAAVIEHGTHDDSCVVSGRVEGTTNVRMELHAATEGLRMVTDHAEPCILHTDCTTILNVEEWWSSRRLDYYTGPDAAWWRKLAAEFTRLDVRVDLLTKGRYGPIHRRAHAIAGAEARGGLRNLPVNATPLDDLHHLRKGQRRESLADMLRGSLTTPPLQVPRLLHRSGCDPAVGCVTGCPVWLRHGPLYGRQRLGNA